MANRNKAKGKSFEREIADVFEEAYGLTFQRVPNSGAFLGGANAFRLDKLSTNQVQMFKGDIIPPDEIPWLTIECKSRKTFPYQQLFDGCKEMDSWIQQVRIDWDALNRKGLFFVIFKPNRHGHYIVSRKDFGLHIKGNFLTYSVGDEVYSISRFDKEFLLTNKDLIFAMCGKEPRIWEK